MELDSSITKDLINSKDPKHTLFCRKIAFVVINDGKEDYNNYDDYDDDHDDDYDDDYDVLNLTQLLMQNSHSLLLSSYHVFQKLDDVQLWETQMIRLSH